MVFQPELFDPDRGQYVCGCGYRSGRVFEEKRPAGVGTRQAANQQTNVSITHKKTEPETSKVQLEIKEVEEEEKEPEEIQLALPNPERDFHLEQITDHLFWVFLFDQKIGHVMDTEKPGEVRYVGVTTSKHIFHGKTLEQVARRLLKVVGK